MTSSEDDEKRLEERFNPRVSPGGTQHGLPVASPVPAPLRPLPGSLPRHSPPSHEPISAVLTGRPRLLEQALGATPTGTPQLGYIPNPSPPTTGVTPSATPHLSTQLAGGLTMTHEGAETPAPRLRPIEEGGPMLLHPALHQVGRAHLPSNPPQGQGLGCLLNPGGELTTDGSRERARKREDFPEKPQSSIKKERPEAPKKKSYRVGIPQRRKHYGENATASEHCHVCCRAARHTRMAVCSNIREGLCRKVICERCFTTYGWDFDATQLKDAAWTCTHCRGVCGERAQCNFYKRANERRKIESEQRWEAENPETYHKFKRQKASPDRAMDQSSPSGSGPAEKDKSKKQSHRP